MQKRTCPCGSLLTSKQKRYCSKPCLYVYRIRPSGLKYKIDSPNPGWFRPHIKAYPEAGFQKGRVPANFLGAEGKYAYTNLHKWVKQHKGKAVVCSDCGASDRMCHWANISHEYKWEVDDWKSLCVPCHKEFDKDSTGCLERIFRCGPW